MSSFRFPRQVHGKLTKTTPQFSHLISNDLITLRLDKYFLSGQRITSLATRAKMTNSISFLSHMMCWNLKKIYEKIRENFKKLWGSNRAANFLYCIVFVHLQIFVEHCVFSNLKLLKHNLSEHRQISLFENNCKTKMFSSWKKIKNYKNYSIFKKVCHNLKTHIYTIHEENNIVNLVVNHFSRRDFKESHPHNSWGR